MSTATVGLPNAATVLRCKVVASRLPSSRASRIMNLANTSRLISSHSGPRDHIAASSALPIADRASGEKTTPCSRYRLTGILSSLYATSEAQHQKIVLLREHVKTQNAFAAIEERSPRDRRLRSPDGKGGYLGRRRAHNTDEYVAAIAAARVVRYLERAGLVRHLRSADRDLPRLGVLPLWQGERQHAVLEVGADLFLIDLVR